MPDTGHNDEPAIRHGRSHCPEIGGRNPAVALAPQHQMRMMDLRHAALQFATLPLAGEIDRRTDPDALGTPNVCSRIRSNSAAISPTPSRNRGIAFGARLSGTNSEDAAVAITARVVSSLLAIIDRKRLI